MHIKLSKTTEFIDWGSFVYHVRGRASWHCIDCESQEDVIVRVSCMGLLTMRLVCEDQFSTKGLQGEIVPCGFRAMSIKIVTTWKSRPLLVFGRLVVY